jgi:hypothetical protein
MSQKLLIFNNNSYHYEIIESIILKYREIFNFDSEKIIDIYLYVNKNDSFKEYITNKYPKIIFKNIKDYDYYINCTIYDKQFGKLNKNKTSVEKYISHEITERLKTNPNVYFLTPLSKNRYIYTDILPYSNEKKVPNIPIYVIQGNLNQGRRYLKLLNKILDQSYEYDFIIKIIGRGHLPKELNKHKNKIVLKNNLNFINFHKEFLDAYCILPLISKNTHSKYYNCKLTSSINYARGYKLKCLIDEDLQEIYKLDNVEVYRDINDIQSSFIKTLKNFYKNTKT